MRQKYYVSLTWDDWPEGGSYGTVVEAKDYDEAEALARREMAASRVEEQQLCYHCGADTDDGEGFDGLCGDCADRKETEPTDAAVDRILLEYSHSWYLVDCFRIYDFVTNCMGKI